MKRIGVRELRQNASEYLRLVKAGETIEVTERGEPVAIMIPIPPGALPIERLRLERRTRLPEGDALEVEPISPTPGVPVLSELIAQDRADER